MTQNIYDDQAFFQLMPNLAAQSMGWMVHLSGQQSAKSYHHCLAVKLQISAVVMVG
ncbi:Uncharacterised protein [Yersinia bercovieri]|nr:Uncharacterised protein [Yersinia bercovieri]